VTLVAVIALPALIAYVAATHFLDGRQLLLRLALAASGALALGGCFFSLGLYLAPRWASLFDVAGELGLLALLVRLRRPPPSRVGPRPRALVVWAMAALLLVALLRFAAESELFPDGGWDAWAIWNLKARFFARAPGSWRRVFEVSYAHPDYPLLLPASIARTWRLLGSEPTLVPRLYGLLCAVAAALFVAAAVARERGPDAACAAVCFLCLGPLPAYAARQYADVPLSAFMAGAVVLLDQPLLCGVMGGLAAWTKNEGLLFLLLLTIVARRPRVLVGAAPFLLLQLWHKHLAPVDDYRQWWTLHTALADVASWPRLRETGVAFAHVIVYLEWPLALPLTLALAKRRPSPSLWPVLVLALAMLSSYFLVMLTTPLPLTEHLATTADRLVMQIHPLLMLAAFLSVPADGSTTSLPAA
jgi:hypothetical protein